MAIFFIFRFFSNGFLLAYANFLICIICVMVNVDILANIWFINEPIKSIFELHSVSLSNYSFISLVHYLYFDIDSHF